VILDIELPDGDGIALGGEFRNKSDAPILFLTGKRETTDKIAGLGKGGDYYLTKPFDRKELTAIIESLLRRAERTKKRIAETTVIQRGPLTMKVLESKAYLGGKDAELTQLEFAVLLALVQNEGKVLSSEYIYRSVWGAGMNNDPNAVCIKISRIKKKLEEHSSREFAINTEYGKGYTFTTNV
jgi:DNA-binding response OmpR family regulator